MGDAFVKSNDYVVVVRRIAGVLSLVISGFIVLAITLGFVPIFMQNGNPIVAVINSIEVLNLGDAPLYYILSHVVLSIVYAVILGFCIKDFVLMLCRLTFWVGEDHDTKLSRSSLVNCVSSGNDIFVRFIILMLASYSVDSYKLETWKIVVLFLLILGNMAVNVMQNYVFKHKFWVSAHSPAITTLILVVTLLFTFNIYDVEIVMFLREFSNAWRAVFSMGDMLPFPYIVHTVVTYVIIPITHMYLLVKFYLAFKNSMSSGTQENAYAHSCKSLMITSAVMAGIIATGYVISEGSIIALISIPMDMVILSVAVFLLTKSQGTDIPDVPPCDELTDEDRFNPNSVNFGEVKIGEFTFDQDSFKL